jgi:hypothetical protein
MGTAFHRRRQGPHQQADQIGLSMRPGLGEDVLEVEANGLVAHFVAAGDLLQRRPGGERPRDPRLGGGQGVSLAQIRRGRLPGRGRRDDEDHGPRVGDAQHRHLPAVGAAFSGAAGQLRFAGGILAGDVNGDGIADFEVKVTGAASLVAGDFVL